MLLNVIHDVHNGIPNQHWHLPYVKSFMYHPSFIRWVFVRAKAEEEKRGNKPKLFLRKEIIFLRSNPLSDFLPPTDADIAEDVVWLLDNWKLKVKTGGVKLPQSYVELARTFYGYIPEQASCERVEYLPGGHRDADRGWYDLTHQEKAQIDLHSVAHTFRSGGDARREE